MLFGDTADVFSPLLTGMLAADQAREAARDAFDRAMHTAGSLTLDYENYADMNMGTKMAGSVENVHTMIACLLGKAKEGQERELTALQV